MRTQDPLLVTDLAVEYLFELRAAFDPPVLIYPVPSGTRNRCDRLRWQGGGSPTQR